MPPDPRHGPRPADLSRADLLRVLAVAPDGAAAAAAGLLGWARDDTAAGSSATPAAPAAAPAVSTAAGAATRLRYLTRPPPRYWRIVGCEALEQPEAAAPDGQSAPEPAPPGPPPPRDPCIPPLLNAGQWQNLWDRLPPSTRPGRDIDLRKSLHRLARAAPLHRLPRCPRRGFNREVVLILDRPPALRPAWDDMLRARDSLQALLGGALPAFQLPAGPAGPWLALPPAAGPAPEHGPDAIPADALVVLIGAFGALKTAEIAPEWRRLIERLRAPGRALLLVPVCPLRQGALPAAPLDPTLTRAGHGGAGHALHTLLAVLSQVWLPTPARLRRLRRAIPAADLYTELCAYNHADVSRGDLRIGLAPGRLLAWSQRFRRLPAAVRAPLEAAIARERRGLDAGAAEIERLQAALADAAPVRARDYPHLARQSAEAVRTLAAGGMALAQFCGMLPVLEQLGAQRAGPDWQPVLRNAHQVARAIGRASPADPADADGAATHGLHQLGPKLEVRPGPGGLLAIGPHAYSVETGRLVDGAPLADLERLEVIDRGRRWQLVAEPRPRWAERCWMDGGDLFAAHAHGVVCRWQPAAPDRPAGRWQPEGDAATWPWAADWGLDPIGLWALLRVRGADYRLRWLPPGRFLMGSPKDEPERDDDERQHPVVLTRGFWLGETAVTQALWQAVTGENPSGFTGPDLPVESVSWDDCQGFLRKLAALAPGLHPRLPTEAQWEYACRAGTRTPFSFGADLDTGQANYNGDYLYNNGPKGEFRRRTLPVGSFAPNAWGLYQMHGNLLEWCADWFGPYPAGEVTDPVGPEQAPGRVVRGGSWRSVGRALRSAYRARIPAVSRRRDFGLRLAGGFDPRASQAGQAQAGAMTADGREQSDRPLGGHGAGEGPAAGGRGLVDRLRDGARALLGAKPQPRRPGPRR
jgi:formylglycine-generating enzyme